jgi:hypothetical protein
MAGIKDYSTTASNNTSVGGVSIAEGMLPSNINNAFRAITADIREFYNDSQWVIYGDGDGAHTFAYASGTSFTIAGANVTSVYHANRRIKAVGSSTGTIIGTISSSSFSTNTTVNVTWDSGSLQSETLVIYLAALSQTNNSIPEDVIDSANLKSNSVSTAKIAADAITGAKIADDAINSEHYTDGSIDTAHIADAQITTAKITDANVTTAKIADANITTSKIANANVTTVKIADANVTTAKIAGDAVDGTKIADDSINSEHYVDGSIDTAHIADSNITTAKIADDAVTIDKIADATIVTNSEHSSSTPNDTSFFTTSASDARYFRQDSTETISSGDTWSSDNNNIATTAAIDARVIDLVDDVGGFVAIANETSFPSANPDVNNGTGTIVSIKEISSTRTPSTGTVTIANGQGSNTVTITGCGSTVLTAGFGVLLETTSTLNTYTFHRLQPKATEVTTVASISSNITTVANNDSNITAVAGDATDIGTVAGISSNVTTVAGISSNVTTVAGNTTNINTVAANDTNVTNVGGSITNVNQLAGALSLETTFTVTVTNPGSGNVFVIDGTNNPTLTIDRGGTYIFDLSDNSNSGHPLAFKDGSGNSYTTGVTTTGTAGNAGAKVTIVVAANAPNSLRYYCTQHGNSMGNTISVVNNNLTTVAANITNVNNTGGSITNVNLVGGSIANVNTVATNITDVNSFANQYRIGSSDPTSSLDAGDLAYNTSDNNLKYYNGSSWTSIAPGIANVVDDSTPQLGGNLDLNSNTINGTGTINFTGNLTATNVAGAGASLTALNASNLASGTVAEARLPASALGAVWESKSANFTAEARKNYFVDTSSNTVTATLPSSASAGDEIRFLDVSGTFDTNKLTVDRNSHKIQGVAADLDVETERAGLGLVYYNATQGWLLKDK